MQWTVSHTKAKQKIRLPIIAKKLHINLVGSGQDGSTVDSHCLVDLQMSEMLIMELVPFLMSYHK